MIKQSFNLWRIPPPTDILFYKIGKIIGRGGFGKVHIGMHKLSRKLVAIKSLQMTLKEDNKTV